MLCVGARFFPTLRIAPGNAERRGRCVPTRSVGTRGTRRHCVPTRSMGTRGESVADSAFPRGAWGRGETPGKTNYAHQLFAKTREIPGLARSSETLCRLAVTKIDKPAFSIFALPPPTAYRQAHNFSPWPTRTYVRRKTARILRCTWGRAHNSSNRNLGGGQPVDANEFSR